MMIRKGTLDDVEKIYVLYNEIIETRRQSNWKKDVYPSRDTAVKAIENDELYVKVFNSEIVGTVIINDVQDIGYKFVNWQEKSDKVLVIHTLVIGPKFQNKNFGKELVLFAQNLGKKQGFEYIRLDTNANNIKAIRFYEKLGFNFRGLLDLDIENFKGLFLAYDKKLF